MDNTNEYNFTALDPETRGKLARLFCEMPFGGGAGFCYPDGGMTGDALLINLTLLRDILRSHSERCQQRDEELSQLQRDVEGVRRIFGNAPDPAPELRVNILTPIV